KVLGEQVTHDRLKRLEASGEWFDRHTWDVLGETQLLGTAIPEEHGGAGLGFFELCLVLEQVGRAVAPLPVWPTLVLAALPIAESGSPEQRARWLPGVASGETILSAALVEAGSDDPEHPETVARRDGTAWRLDGTKTCVPVPTLAAQLVVPAQ